MDIKRYIAESEKQFKLRLKTIVPLDDEAMDAIEFAVAKYQPLELSSPKKTILQANPVDFVNVHAAEVYIVDMTFSLPVSSNVMREDIRKALNCPETFVVVRYPNEAIEIEGERKAATDELEVDRKKKGLRFAALLSTGKDYPEVEETAAADLFGDEYNASLVGYLAKIQKEREDAKIKADNAPFVWLDIPDRKDQEPVQDDSNFNKDIKGAPGTVKGKTNKSIEDRKITGSIDDRKKITRLFKDAKGNRVAASVMMGDKQ